MLTNNQQVSRIKVCGITRPEDAQAAARLGVDAIGLVFAQGSKRRVTLEQAREVIAATPPLVTIVALFMDQSVDDIDRVLQQVHIDLLQFHGAETPAFCQRFQRPFIKAVAMGGVSRGELNPEDIVAPWSKARGLLFDAHRPGETGGQGIIFDWSRLPRHSAMPLILAGGLKPSNVGAAVRQVRPYAVDVSSGVEITPGIKDHALMQQFVEEVRRVNAG